MLNFQDERSKLFFVYVDILNHIKSVNPNVKFLLENVRMKPEYQEIINQYLGVEPVKINSLLVSASRRDRLYWANFEFSQPIEKDISFDDINQNSQDWLSDNYIEKVTHWKAHYDPIKQAIKIGEKQKIHCLTARGYNQSHSGMVLITDGVKYRYLTNNEAELAMTLPIDYTAGINDRERARTIGNGWTVDVIAHIFGCLRNCNEN
jgi:site-specific DNA-cytosine methylase